MVDPDRVRLRGTTALAAPLGLLGLMSSTLAVAVALWGAWHPDELGAAFVVPLVVAGLLGVGSLVARRGCFVELTEDELRDVVAWRTARRIPRDSIVDVRVLAGTWRWFELELSDGQYLRVVGVGPAQLPARLLPGAREGDLALLAQLRGAQA